jgi:hypothetical protein
MRRSGARAWDHQAVGSGALDAFVTGDLPRLASDGSVAKLEDRRKAGRVPTSIDVSVRRTSGLAQGRITERSTGGALLVVRDAKLEIGERVRLEAEEDGEVLEVRVARNGIPGIYGVAFVS